MSKRKQIICECVKCKKVINKDLSEVKRNIKMGRQSFCSISCAVTYRNLNDPKYKTEEFKHQFKERMKGYPNPSKPDEYTLFRESLRKIKMRYKQNIDKFYNVTLQDLKNQWELQNGKCPYSGIKLSLTTVNNPIYKASVDRIDSSKGYIVGNIQWVSQAINYMKSTMSHEETLKLCKFIATNYNSNFLED